MPHALTGIRPISPLVVLVTCLMLASGVGSAAASVEPVRVDSARRVMVEDVRGFVGPLSTLVGDGHRYVAYRNIDSGAVRVRDTKLGLVKDLKIPSSGLDCGVLDADDRDVMVGCWRGGVQRRAFLIDIASGTAKRIRAPGFEPAGTYNEWMPSGLGRHWLAGKQCPRVFDPSDSPTCLYFYLNRTTGQVRAPDVPKWDLEHRRLRPMRQAPRRLRKPGEGTLLRRPHFAVLQADPHRVYTPVFLRSDRYGEYRLRPGYRCGDVGGYLDLSRGLLAWSCAVGHREVVYVYSIAENRRFRFPFHGGVPELAATDNELVIASGNVADRRQAIWAISLDDLKTGGGRARRAGQ